MSETLAQDFKKLVKDYKQHPDWATYEAQYGTKRARYELAMKLLKNGEVIPIPGQLTPLIIIFPSVFCVFHAPRSLQPCLIAC
jgi:hypothetical protein